MVKNAQLFGCHIGVVKRIFGGFKGKSSGKFNLALKIPPSLWWEKRSGLVKLGEHESPY